MARGLAVLALAAALLAGCGEKPEPAASKVTAVRGTLDLARPAPGAPDAGTVAGHKAPGATASTTRASLAFSGRVEPATSQVTLRPAGGTAAPVDVADDGSFRARARKLERGENRFVLVGRAAGLVPWEVDIAITRRQLVLDVATAAGSLLAAFGLSGAAGLNAWIPLLAVGLLSRAGQLELPEGYDVLATTPGLIVLGVLFALDFVGDKVPAIDSLLHAAGTVVHPLSGAIVFAGPTEMPTEVPTLVLFALGASVAGSLHATRATIRPASTTLTAGAGNPFLSLVEDIGSAVLSVVAVVAPVLGALGLIALVAVAAVWWRRIRRSRRRRGLP